MNIDKIRQDFPILDQEVNQEKLIYFDHAATSQKPQQVIQSISDFYQKDNANIHRGIHSLSQAATDLYEGGRQKLADFIGAQQSHEIIFNRGTTEGINFLMRSLLEDQLNEGDQVLTSRLDHHSVIVPCQALCQRTGASLEYLPLDEETLMVDLEAFKAMNLSKVKAIVLQHVSNVLGVEHPIKAITEFAHQHEIMVIVDGAQALPHMSVNMKDLGVDAYCFSGHKMYGPSGIGVCYLAQKHHDRTKPLFYGGEMIHEVKDYSSTFKESPWKFEAGTMPLAQVVGLTAAVAYISSLGYEAIAHHEEALTQRLYQGLSQIEGIELYQDPTVPKHGIVSFNIKGVHPHDAASAYDMEGIALRAGHHCCQPLMRLLQCQATLRASLGVYNHMNEVDRFIEVTRKVRDFFRWD